MRLVAELGLLRQEQDLPHADRLVGEDLRAGVGAPVEDVDRRDDLHRVALGERLALLAGQEVGDLVDLVDEHVGRLAQVPRPIRERQLRPEGLDLGDVIDDGLHLVGLQRLDRADQLAGRRVEGLELRPSPDSMYMRVGGRSRPRPRIWNAHAAGGARQGRVAVPLGEEGGVRASRERDLLVAAPLGTRRSPCSCGSREIPV